MRLQAFLGVAVAAIFWGGCAWGEPSPQSLKVGQLIETQTGHPVSFENLRPFLVGADVIFIGEEHYTPSHIESAIRVLEAVRTGGKRPALAMEMFGWDGQVALNHYVQGDIQDPAQFLTEVHWEKNWGGTFAAYAPLVDYAKEHALPLYGLNPPRSLIQKVVTKGIAKTRQDPERVKWGFNQDISLEDPAYHRVLFEQLQKCHPGMTEGMYTRYYEASIFRDEGMAKIIVDAVHAQDPGKGPVVSYTGGGHIQYHVPVPSRVTRELGDSRRYVSMYLNVWDSSREEDVQQAIKEKIADFIWLTPPGPDGPAPRCGA